MPLTAPPKGTPRGFFPTRGFQAERFILSALLCAGVSCVTAAESDSAGVWPGPAERQPSRALRSEGAQRAKAMTLYFRATRVLEEKGPQDALPLFREVMMLDLTHAGLADRVASLAVTAGQPGEARRILEEAVRRRPDAEGPAAALAEFLVSHQDENVQVHAEALGMVKDLLLKFPGSARVCALAVRLFLNDQRRPEAQAAVRLVIARENRDPQFWLTMMPVVREAFPLDDPDTRQAHQALVAGCVERATTLAPRDPHVLEAAADFYARLQMPAQATGWYRKLTALQPGNLTARRKLGQCLRLTGDNTAARKLFEELLQIDSADAVAHRAMAALCEAENQPREALRHRSELLRIDGGLPGEYLKLAAQLDTAGLKEERRLTLERGCFAHPQSPRLAVAWAGALHRAGKLREAVTQFERAETLAARHEPEALDADYFLSRAACARDSGGREEAARHFRAVIDKAPKGKPEKAAAAYGGLALLWLEDGIKLEEARELLRIASGLKKEDAGVAEGLGLYAARKGEWESALREYLRAESLLPAGAGTGTAFLLRLTEALEHTGRKEEAITRLEKLLAGPEGTADTSLHERLAALRGPVQSVQSEEAAP